MNETSVVQVQANVVRASYTEVGYNGTSPGLKEVGINEFLPAGYDLWNNCESLIPWKRKMKPYDVR